MSTKSHDDNRQGQRMDKIEKQQLSLKLGTGNINKDISVFSESEIKSSQHSSNSEIPVPCGDIAAGLSDSSDEETLQQIQKKEQSTDQKEIELLTGDKVTNTNDQKCREVSVIQPDTSVQPVEYISDITRIDVEHKNFETVDKELQPLAVSSNTKTDMNQWKRKSNVQGTRRPGVRLGFNSSPKRPRLIKTVKSAEFVWPSSSEDEVSTHFTAEVKTLSDLIVLTAETVVGSDANNCQKSEEDSSCSTKNRNEETKSVSYITSESQPNASTQLTDTDDGEYHSGNDNNLAGMFQKNLISSVPLEIPLRLTIFVTISIVTMQLIPMNVD